MNPSRLLGNTNQTLPAIGQGTTKMGGYESLNPASDLARIKAIRIGIDLGLNLIDTAELYGGGHSEEVVGKAVRGIRDQVLIASKFNPGHATFQGVIQSLENSLKRLQTDYLDLYQLHWPNPDIPMEETLSGLHSLVRDGKIRFIGVSNFTQTELIQFQSLSELPIVSNQMEYNLLERSIEEEMLPHCQNNKVTLLAYSPLDRANKLLHGPKKKLLQTLANRYNKSTVQIMLNWILSHPGIVALVKAGSQEHIQENAHSLDFDLCAEDIQTIDRAFSQEIINIIPSRIRISANENFTVYQTISEAIENPLDLIPSPQLIAHNILRGHWLKPLGVVKTTSPVGQYEYDLADSPVFYWGWVIAKGEQAAIPCSQKDR
jgi:diketogulonate reductase-like aldo/keto reductase